MVARKKTWQEKMDDPKDLPKVIELTGKMAERFGAGTMAIPSPREVDNLIKDVPAGEVVTTNDLRQRVAKKHKADVACQITTGIFAWMAAHAADEAASAGETEVTPWWRVVKSDGSLNPKYPGGAERQAALLRAEGIEVSERRGKLTVAVPKP